MPPPHLAAAYLIPLSTNCQASALPLRPSVPPSLLLSVPPSLRLRISPSPPKPHSAPRLSPPPGGPINCRNYRKGKVLVYAIPNVRIRVRFLSDGSFRPSA